MTLDKTVADFLLDRLRKYFASIDYKSVYSDIVHKRGRFFDIRDFIVYLRVHTMNKQYTIRELTKLFEKLDPIVIRYEEHQTCPSTSWWRIRNRK